MTRADGDFFVPIILRSILVIVFKEESFKYFRDFSGLLASTGNGGKFSSYIILKLHYIQ